MKLCECGCGRLAPIAKANDKRRRHIKGQPIRFIATKVLEACVMIVHLKESEQSQHKNGGGWIAHTAKVADSVFVGKFACVYGHAELAGKVRVLDTAQVSGHAKLSGDVVVYGNCWLDGNFKASTGHFHANAKVQSKQERLRPAEG